MKSSLRVPCIMYISLESDANQPVIYYSFVI